MPFAWQSSHSVREGGNHLENLQASCGIVLFSINTNWQASLRMCQQWNISKTEVESEKVFSKPSGIVVIYMGEKTMCLMTMSRASCVPLCWGQRTQVLPTGSLHPLAPFRDNKGRWLMNLTLLCHSRCSKRLLLTRWQIQLLIPRSQKFSAVLCTELCGKERGIVAQLMTKHLELLIGSV